mgnify:CR=1 FL=1
MRYQHDIPVLLTGCLAAGGAGMFLIMSVLIGFGVSSSSAARPCISACCWSLSTCWCSMPAQVRCCAAEKRRSPLRRCAFCAV